MMKRLLAVLLFAATALSFAAAAHAQGMVPGTPEQVRVVLPIRHYNNSGVNALLTVPTPLDSSYASQQLARVDTTVWFGLKDCVPGFPNFASGTLASDTAFVFRLGIGAPDWITTVATNDSFYYALQFADNTNLPIADQNGTTCKGAGITGSGQYAQGFFTLPTCLFSHQSFYGAGACRFIFTWPANTVVPTYRQVKITYNTNKLGSQR